MDFWKSMLGLARHRFIGPPIFAAAIMAAVIAYFVMPTHYVTSTSMVLTTPATGGTLSADPQEPPGLTNPLLQFNDGLQTTAGILILSMNTPEAMSRLGVTPGGAVEVTINDGRTNPDLLGISTNGPYVYVEVDALSPAVADATVRRASLLLRQELAARQRALNAPPSTYIAITDVVPPGTPEAKDTTRWGAAAGVLGAVVAAGLGLAYLAERLRAGRRAARVTHAPWVAAYPLALTDGVDGADRADTDGRAAGTGGASDGTRVIVVVPATPDGEASANGVPADRRRPAAE